jgi:hypothetical protein
MTFQNDEDWRDYVPFHEYFHGDNGAGVGASHQTGWTAVVANLLQQRSEGDSTRKTGSASTNSKNTIGPGTWCSSPFMQRTKIVCSEDVY